MTSILDEHQDYDRQELDNLTTPRMLEGNLRNILETHLLRLVEQHNEELAARVHYLQTGEIIHESVKRYTPFMVRDAEPHKVLWAIKQIQARVLDLNYVLHSVDDIGQYTELSELSDAQFAMVYNRLLIELKNIRLPDTSAFM